ncbi:branched-chain amino acid transport system II carrier protein, partial [Pseudomonas sp.]|uniref:branched-chain amino acid transport system II carrier protein n=1 Tax=Pseudomonas sp. TaxID=306 RepID=UPI00258ABBAB
LRFGLPIARDMCQKVIVVASNDLQSLYVANNVCSAVDYFRRMGGNVGVAGMVINKDDGTGEANAFAQAVGIPVLTAIYPPCIALVALSFCKEFFRSPARVFAPVMAVSLAFGLVDALKGAGFSDWLPDSLAHLPLSDQGLAWLVPSVVALAAAVVVDRLIGKPAEAVA